MMFGFFDYKKLDEIATTEANAYVHTQPFPHLVIDDAALPIPLHLARSQFPHPGDLSWWTYNNHFEKKLAFDRVHELPRPILEALLEMNGSQFVTFLEKLTGITGLIPDPHFVGGGLHQIERGGKLKLHLDFNKHRGLNLDRRLNVILYLNEHWLPEYGGDLELWDLEKTECKTVSPVFNRMVIFNTDNKSLHGHPHALTCPEGWTRKSLALYYYSNGRPASEQSDPHSTEYHFSPGEVVTPELEELRKKRAKGRI